MARRRAARAQAEAGAGAGAEPVPEVGGAGPAELPSTLALVNGGGSQVCRYATLAIGGIKCYLCRALD